MISRRQIVGCIPWSDTCGSAPKEVIDGALERLSAVDAIPSVRAIAVGPNVWPKDPNCVWTHGLTLVFDSVHVMMSEFMDHPIHQAIMSEVFPLYKEVMAMDVESSAPVAV